jgi:gas vesicle protein
MLENRKNNSGWFVVGLGLGALVGILFAPQSGRETRKAIASGVDDGLEHLTAFGRDARERVSNIVESGKNLLTRKKEQVGTAIDTAKELLKRRA